MVHFFLISTVCPLLQAGESRVLYSRVFGPDDAPAPPPQDEEESLSAERRRALGKDQLLLVARQVLSSVTLSREAAAHWPVEGGASAAGAAAAAASADEGPALQEADSGVLRLRAGDPFPGERSVLWLAVRSLAFSLACRPQENLLLAQTTLRGLARHCLEHLHLLGPGSEVLLKVDRVDFLLSKLLPHGQLLFLNHRFTQSLEKDITAYMAK